MNLWLERLQYLDDCTLGRLHIDDAVFPTMERARIGDHPCISPGVYDLKPHISPKHGEVYSFIGGNVYEWEVPAGLVGRCLVLLHSANTAEELLGCVAPGLTTGFFGQVHAVLNSKAAMSAISTLLGRVETHKVRISDPVGA